MAVPSSPARRVLSDKTTNALITQRCMYEPAKKPSLEPMTSSNQTSTQNENVTKLSMKVTQKAGQKRRIHEVDDTEEQGQLEEKPGSSSPPAIALTSFSSDAPEGGLSFSVQTLTTTSLSTSFLASQEPPMTIEDQFEIQDEMSQQTLDKIHATALPQNTSQLQPSLRPALIAGDSQDSVGMSSFIDFGLTESDGVDLKMTSPSTTHAESRPVKADLIEKVETLRTRLQLAIYKVKTNQVGKPFSRLEKPRSSSPELPPQPPSLGRANPEGIVAAARARATGQRKPPVRNLNALPIPTIVPTAYSARYTEQQNMQTLSSPPPSDGSAEPVGPVSLERSGSLTPRQEKATYPETPLQLSSPPGSVGPEATTKYGESREFFGELTSSVVKGEAANGLLELMRAGVH